METIHYQHFPVPAAATVLANGLTVITATTELDTVRVALHFAVGSRDDGDYPGISHFLEHLLFEGPNRDHVHPQLRYLLPLGVEAYGGLEERETEYALAGEAADLAKMVAALGQICLSPGFDQTSVKNERGPIRAEIIGQGKNKNRFFLWSRQVMFPTDNWPHTPQAGTLQSIELINHEAAREHHRNYYTPTNAALIVVGGITHEQALSAARELAGSWPTPRILPSHCALKPANVESIYPYPDKPPGIVFYFDRPAGETENTWLDLATFILTSAPLGLIFQELRVRRHLIYSSWSETGAWPLDHTALGIDAASIRHFPAIMKAARRLFQQLAAGNYEPDLLQTALATDQRWRKEGRSPVQNKSRPLRRASGGQVALQPTRD